MKYVSTWLAVLGLSICTVGCTPKPATPPATDKAATPTTETPPAAAPEAAGSTAK